MIEFLEARPAQFDLITGYDIIEHFHKDEALRFLDAAYAALKSGGRLVLKTPNNGGIWDEHRYNDLNSLFCQPGMPRGMRLISGVKICAA